MTAQNAPSAPPAPTEASTHPDGPEGHSGAQGGAGGDGGVILDLGDELGYWVGCLGHVDRYEFLVALADLTGDEAMSMPKNPPQHAYMVEFDDDDGDCWFQLDAVNEQASSIRPITILAVRDDEPPLTIKRAAPLPTREPAS